ncbi:YqaJ viral recombinase family protein [Pelomyxa schiedti]|nr:YqaJ viral recombinase family protein [Pelomyxa schiedti]
MQDVWVTSRQRGLTASDAPAACGLSNYASPTSLWEAKTGRVQRGSEPSDATSHGFSCEPKMLKFYELVTGCPVKSSPTLWHPLKPFFGATPDGVTHDSLTGEKRMLEVKCPLYAVWEDHIPPHVMVQVQMQLEVTNSNTCDLIAYFCRIHVAKIWRVYRSKDFWNWLEKRLLYFWSCVSSDTPPEKDQLPILYQAANNLAKSNYDYSQLKGLDMSVIRLLPPKVKYELLALWEGFDADQVAQGPPIPTFISSAGALTIQTIQTPQQSHGTPLPQEPTPALSPSLTPSNQPPRYLLWLPKHIVLLLLFLLALWLLSFAYHYTPFAH